ncbi:MAG TPA: hypothetical protein VFH45_02080 [Acidimicrobiales bacterium]|nr:hypothetical protein [Acidimicrobiales bacterium]
MTTASEGGPTSGDGRVAGCELCEAARFTPWYHEDDLCWVAECESCSTPMVVWRRHGTEPPPEDVERMIAHLERVATDLYGEGNFHLDRVMRQIPDHFHAHARDTGWWRRRFS